MGKRGAPSHREELSPAQVLKRGGNLSWGGEGPPSRSLRGQSLCPRGRPEQAQGIRGEIPKPISPPALHLLPVLPVGQA